ncbi:UDP-N-acetylmuramoyl-tripeptide--D-alanyl-D-alanine ligase [Rhodobacteraceae bacterium CCMM004]|nr:UDP-N-acetylmuramoyl-tripeptide--D-alanyl-D-alanine ligase [Rhodobacteraceae bacterium CCMM004]
MSALWTSAAAAEATGGTAARDWHATGVSIDTRTLAPGDLFVALTAARDGHDFVAQALDKGAAAALVSRVPEGVGEGAPLLLVDDVQRALERLGAAGRARSAARVAAITGSVGKTSTKEMLRAALSSQGRVHAAEASYNNHWGVPLTLARMPADTDYAIVEIGMSAPGEIAPLSRLARPHVAVVTTVAAAHLEAFEDLDGIAREKASIYEGLEPGGTAIWNADIATAPILAAAAEAHAARHLRFGATEGVDLRRLSATLAQGRTVVEAEGPDGPFLFKLDAPGRHLADNGLAVLAVARALGADMAVAANDLGRWSPTAGRGTRERIVLDPDDPDRGIDLFDDAFNANPASVAAALDVLIGTEPLPGGRRVAILGDMLELGPEEAEMHAAIARHPGLDAVDTVHTLGPRMAALRDALPEGQRGVWHETADAMAGVTHTLLRPGDLVLVKGSKASLAARVVDAIRKLGHRRAPAHTDTT